MKVAQLALQHDNSWDGWRPAESVSEQQPREGGCSTGMH